MGGERGNFVRSLDPSCFPTFEVFFSWTHAGHGKHGHLPDLACPAELDFGDRWGATRFASAWADWTPEIPPRKSLVITTDPLPLTHDPSTNYSWLTAKALAEPEP